MPTTKKVVLPPTLLNGMRFTICGGGDLARTVDGHTIILSDPIRSKSRFK